MRGLSIAALLAMATLCGGCVQPQPLASIATPASEEQAPISTKPPTVDSPAAPIPSSTIPAASDSTQMPTVAVPTPPKESAPTAQSSQAPPAPSPPQASASRPEELPTPDKPPAVASSSPAVAAASPAVVESSPAALPAEPPASPTLDLAGLTQRLRDTDAIGMFTKLSLKNQVDDLLNQFRGFYRGEIEIPLEQLRQRYETLLLKVLTLVQDADQQLARAIASSRELIWGILADPQKFAQI